MNRAAATIEPAIDPDPSLLLGALPYAIVVLGISDTIRYVNHAAEQFFGQGSGHLCGPRTARCSPSSLRRAARAPA
jgi:nitrogen-specific signal transduction histidine kinase